MTNTMTSDEQTAIEISNSRLDYLKSRGEDDRNTVAWRDAIAERHALNMAIAMRGRNPYA